jgi:hypothetical protein
VADIIEDSGIERKELVSRSTRDGGKPRSGVEPSVQATVVEDMQVEKAS